MADDADQKLDAKPKSRLTLGLVWAAVRHHPLIFGALLVLAGVVGAVVWAFMPLPKHTAAVVFQVSGYAPRVSSATAENQPDLNSYKQRQAALIKRRVVLNAVRKRPEAVQAVALQQMPPEQQVDWLDRNLQIDAGRGGLESIRVYIEGDQPDELLAILKALQGAYLAEVEQLENGARNQQLTLLDEAITRQKGEIDARQKNIAAIAKTLHNTSPAMMVLHETLLQDEFRAARHAVHQVEYELALTRPDVPANPDGKPEPMKPAETPDAGPTAALDDAVRREPAVQQAEGKVLATKQDLAKLEGQLQPGAVNPAVLRAREAVKTAEADRDRLKTELRGRMETAYKDQLVAGLAAAKAVAGERTRELERRKVVADAQLKDVTDRVDKHNRLAADVVKYQTEIGHLEKLLASMTEERAKLLVEEKALKRVSVSDEPFVVAGVEGSRRWRNAGIAAGGLVLLGMVGLVGWEYRRRRVGRPDELAAALGLPLLGTLPPLTAGGSMAKREMVEAIDSTRTTLLHRRADAPHRRTLVVTSGLPGEGKTSLSSHLAVSLARAGFRTLLVDGDVHRPSVHTLFSLPAGPGLCELLRGETGTAAAVRPTAVPGLSVLPAGEWTLAARQALVRDRWQSLRTELESEFDYLVVDTAPLLLITDTQLLVQAADGVILSALVGVSDTAQTALTNRRLEALGVKVLGVVVGGDLSMMNRRYRYYHAGGDADSSADTVPLSKA